VSGEPAFSVQRMQAACSTCTVHELCLPFGVGAQDLARLEQIVQRSRPLARGAALFREGDAFRALYAVRSGAFKSVHGCADGSEQVLGFHLPGELIGLDGMTEGRHLASALALDVGSVCKLPFQRLEELAGNIPALQHQLLRLMGREFNRREHQLLVLGKHGPERRLAVLLLSLSTRFAQRGFAADRFTLPMARVDIANYLGLAPETVSRLLRRLQDDGVVRVHGREVDVLAADALHRRAGVQLRAPEHHVPLTAVRPLHPRP
jgi:CRP/FNR family transcriptional regulator, anaerobic regulatory protein